MSEESGDESIRQGSLRDVVLGAVNEHSQARVFLCGAPDMVTQLRREAFLAGISNQDILADAFFPTQT